MTRKRSDQLGQSTSPAYKAFSNLLHRHRADLDPAWLDYQTFLTEMGPQPAPGMGIIRHDPTQPYSQTNCAWGVPKKRKTDYTGMVFGDLVVVHELPLRPPSKNTVWQVQCTCGETTTVWSHNLTSGKTTSCGHNRLKGFRDANTARAEQAKSKKEDDLGVRDPVARAVIRSILERTKT